MSKPIMPISGTRYNLKLRGGAGDKNLLSLKKDGTGVELVAEDDGSGYQRWSFLEYFQGSGNCYSLQCFVNGQSYFVNNPPYKKSNVVGPYPGVNTHIWKLQPQVGRFFYFASEYSSVPSQRFLGITQDDHELGLHHIDDGSGGQQWQLCSTEPVTDKLDPYFENEVLNLMRSCPDMVTVLLKNQCMSESRVSNDIFYANPQPGGKNESAIDELLRVYMHQINDQSNWPFDMYWSLQIAIARSNSSSRWHNYAINLPKGKYRITRSVADSWMGLRAIGWSGTFDFDIYVV